MDANAGLMPVQLRFKTGLTGADYVTPCANYSSSPFTWSLLSRNFFAQVAYALSSHSPLVLKHQLLICNRSRQRAPNLTSLSRVVLGTTMLFVSPRCRQRLGGMLNFYHRMAA